LKRAVVNELIEEQAEEVCLNQTHLAPKKNKKQRSFSSDSEKQASSRAEEDEEAKTSLLVSQ
jgi:hypothetical protein